MGSAARRALLIPGGRPGCASQTRSMASARPWPTPTHMVASRAGRRSSLMERGEDQPRTAHPQRVAEGDGTAVRVDLLTVVGHTQFAQAGQALAGEGFVEFDHVEGVDRQVQAPQQLAHRRHRADAHDPWGDAGAGHAQHPRARSQAVLLHCLGGGQDQRGGAVVDPGRVAGGDGLLRPVDRQAGPAPPGWCRDADARRTRPGCRPCARESSPGRFPRRRNRPPAPCRRAAGCAGRRHPGRHATRDSRRRRCRRSAASGRCRTAPSSAG